MTRPTFELFEYIINLSTIRRYMYNYEKTYYNSTIGSIRFIAEKFFARKDWKSAIRKRMSFRSGTEGDLLTILYLVDHKMFWKIMNAIHEFGAYRIHFSLFFNQMSCDGVMSRKDVRNFYRLISFCKKNDTITFSFQNGYRWSSLSIPKNTYGSTYFSVRTWEAILDALIHDKYPKTALEEFLGCVHTVDIPKGALRMIRRFDRKIGDKVLNEIKRHNIISRLAA